jgi:hypothetical protein
MILKLLYISLVLDFLSIYPAYSVGNKEKIDYRSALRTKIAPSLGLALLNVGSTNTSLG